MKKRIPRILGLSSEHSTNWKVIDRSLILYIQSRHTEELFLILFMTAPSVLSLIQQNKTL